MKYGSVCSGIEAATMAWHPLGWEPQWLSEGDKQHVLEPDPFMAFQASELRLSGKLTHQDQAPTVKAETKQGDSELRLLQGSTVRRLTPRECERLQGFPDDFTKTPYRGREASDGPRYKALGNSMAVPVMRWIGERIKAVSELKEGED